MRKIIFLISILVLISCKREKTEIQNNKRTETVKVLKKRDFPIKNFSKIELLSYYNRMKWDNEYQGKRAFNKILVDNYKLTFDTTMIRERVVLNKDQERELLNLMALEYCHTGETPADCYNPRHMILFRDDKNRIIGYNEFCFSCLSGRNSGNLDAFQKFCYSDMEIFFKKSGLRFFLEGTELDGDLIHENEEYDFLKSKGFIKNQN